MASLILSTGFLASFETESTSNNNLYKQEAMSKGQGYFNENGKFESSVKSIEQVYYFNYSNNLYALAYEITIVATNSVKAEKIFLSCANGSILGSESLVCNVIFLEHLKHSIMVLGILLQMQTQPQDHFAFKKYEMAF